MNTIKAAAVCSVLAYCDTAYDLWGWSGVAWSIVVFAGAVAYFNRTWRKGNDRA
jgi:hypothetical protein